MFNKHFNLNNNFGQSKTRQNKERKQKILSMETLEARVLLSVSPSSMPLEEADASSSTAYVSVVPELTYVSNRELTVQLDKDVDFITTENQNSEIIHPDSTNISGENTNIAGNQLLAQGNIITVTTANDTENSSDGVTSLREAIASASAGDTICFSSSLAGQTITLNSTLSISKNLTIDASNLSSKVTISGNNACRVLSISSSTVTLNNLQICNGKLTASNSKGAGIYTSNSNLTLISCNFENNVIVNTKSGGYGGAIYFYTGNLTVESCKFKSNYVTANIGSGGAINFRGTTVKINNSEFDENYLYESLQITSSNYNTLSTVNLQGGALYFYATNVELKNSNLYHNRATATITVTGSYENSSVIQGGGAYIYATSSFLAENVDFDQNYVKTSNNYGTQTNGGGLYLTGSSSENVMKNCKFLTNGVQSNSTEDGIYVAGGGIYASAVLQMESCQVSANYAISTSTSNRYAYGGGIYALEGSTFTNTIISGNVAIANYQSNKVQFVSGTMSRGGGVYLFHSTTAKSWSSSKFTNCTIVYNMANWLGGGVYLATAGAIFRNSIVIDNSSYNSPDVYAYASSSVSWTIPLGFKSSYIGEYYYSNSITFTADSNSNHGIVSYSGDLFQSAYSKTSYGAGVTVTISLPITASLNWDLTPVSTNLIDKGDNSLNSTTTDINGNSRIANSTIDIGAIEAGGTVSKVSITGVTLSTNSPKVGTEIKAIVSPSGATCKYQWSYGSSTTGTFTDIPGATSYSYTPTSTYLGKYLRCTVTGSENYTGTAIQTTTSAITQDQITETLTKPTNLKSTGKTSNSVSLSWTGDSRASSYTVMYSTSSSFPYSSTSTKTGITSTSGTITGLTAGTTYYFKVMAVSNNSTYKSSEESDYIAVKTLIPLNKPSAPTCSGKTTNSVSLSWDSVSNASSYTVIYSTSSSFTNSTTKTGITSTSDTITGLNAGTTYYFKVMAVGNGTTYESSSYGSYTAVTTSSNTTQLSKPTNLQSTGKTSNSVSLSWTGDSRASSYTVMYSTSSSFTNSTTKTGITSTSDTITGLTAGTTYYFKVMAVGNGTTYESSSYGSYTAVTTSSNTTQLSKPTNLQSTGKTSNSVSLSWTGDSRASSYTVMYSTSSSFTNSTTKTGITSTSDTITGLNAGTTYYFKVMAVGNNSTYKSSEYSDYTAVTTSTVGVDNVGDSSSTAKTISFTNNTFTFTDKLGEGTYGLKDVDIYKLVVSSSDIGRTYTFTTSQPSGGTSVDTYLRLFNSSSTQIASDDDGGSGIYSKLTWTPTTTGTYYLGVSSCSNSSYNLSTAGSAGNGRQGDYTLTVTRTTPLSTPSAPTCSSKTSNSVSLSWTGDSRASSYTVIYSTSASFTNSTTKTGITSTSGTITGLTANTTYYFKVMAVGNGSTYTSSSYGNYTAVTTSSNTTQLSKPTAPTCSAKGSYSVLLNWTGDYRASSYTVMYSTSSSFTNSTTKTGITSTSGTITGLTAGTTYYFKVMAVSNNSTYESSEYSTYTTVTTLKISNASLSTLEPKVGETITVTVPSSEVFTTCTYTWKRGNTTISTNSSYTPTKEDVGYELTCSVYRTINIGSYSESYSNTCSTESVQAQSTIDNVGDSSSTAKTISFTNNTFTFTDKLGEGTYGLKDVDIYKLVVSSSDIGRTYTFTTSQPSGGTRVDTYIRLFNSSGTQITSNDDGGSNLYSKLTWTPTTTGTYYLGVSSCSNNSYNLSTAGSAGNGRQGDYTLTVTRTTPLSTPSAPTCSSKTSNSVSLSWTGDSRASSYTVIYSTSSSFTNSTTKTGITSTSDTISGLSANTTYYFKVMAVGNGSTYTNSAYGNYTTITTTTQSVSVDNVGDSSSTAKTISFTNNTFTFTDKLGEGSYGLKDVDIYKLVVSSSDIGRTYTFTTSQPFDGDCVDTYIRLFNSSSTQIASDDNGGSAPYSKLTWTPTTTGTYYLGVSSYSNNSYNLSTAGSAGNGRQGDYTLTVTRTVSPTLTVSTSVSDGKTVNLSWNSVSGANSYTVQYKVSNTSKWTQKTVYGNSFTIKGRAGCNYDIYVTSNNGSTSFTTASCLSNLKLKTAYTTDSTFGISVSGKSSNSALYVTLYNQRLAIPNDGSSVTFNCGVKCSYNSGQLRFENAQASCQYDVQVQQGISTSTSLMLSAVAKGKAKTATTSYNAPTNVSAVAISDSQITVSWTAATGKNSNAHASSYTVQYCVAGTGAWKNATTKASGTSYTISKLSSSTQYEVRVIASKDRSFTQSVPSTSATAQTKLKLDAVKLSKSTVTANSLSVRVSNVSYYATHMLVTVGSTSAYVPVNGTTTYIGSIPCTYQNGCLNFTNLYSNTNYNIQVLQVRMVNSITEAISSKATTFRGKTAR